MPQVVFREDFFDGSKRYRKGEEYTISDSVVLPKFDIAKIDGKAYDRPLRDNKPPRESTRGRAAQTED
jgi:hypothetical protein